MRFGLLLLLGLAGCASTWPQSPTEQVALAGIEARSRLLADEIGRVASGDRTLARQIVSISYAWHQLDADAERLASEAAKRLGVAVVQSGNEWVVKH